MRTKKVKPPPKEHEYVLNIAREFDEIKKADYISFKFSTTKEFLTFQYILKIESKFSGKDLFFNILGFSAPAGELSNYGQAGYEYRMYDFGDGEYQVTIDKRDSETSKFRLAIRKANPFSIKLSDIPKKTFIQIKSNYDTETV
jgi:hypothetical protein